MPNPVVTKRRRVLSGLAELAERFVDTELPPEQQGTARIVVGIVIGFVAGFIVSSLLKG